MEVPSYPSFWKIPLVAPFALLQLIDTSLWLVSGSPEALRAIHLPSLANVGSMIGPANRSLRALSIDVQIADFDAFSSEVRCRPSKSAQFGHTGFASRPFSESQML